MLVKIAKAPYFEGSDNNSFMLIQAKEILRFKTQPYWQFRDTEELLQQYAVWREQNLSTLSTIDIERLEGDILASTLSEERIYRANYIVIKDMDNKEVQYVFDTIAYICNDKGETLEKCFAGGILNK